MFQRLLQWIRDWIGKMINKTSIKDVLGVDIEISSEMVSALQEWSRMYENKASWLSEDVKSLNLPAAIASEIARAVTIEMSVVVTGSRRGKYLDELMQTLLLMMRKQVEYGSAKGGLIMKPYVNKDKIEVDFIQADHFFPVSFDSNGNITACVFVDQRTIGKDYFTRLEYHTMTDEGCDVINAAFKSHNKDTLGTRTPLETVPDWAGLEEEATITDIDKPLFAYFRYPLVNNIDTDSPLGVSCFSRSIDLIRQADEMWSNLLWEFESGKRALYVDELAFGKTDDGRVMLPIKRLIRTLDMGGQKDEFFQEWTPTLREANILAGLDAILKKIEFNSGLAYGTLSDPMSVEKTATEILSAKQRSAATIVDVQKSLRTALDDLLYSIDVWCDLAKVAPRGTYSVEYDFDDSLIVDKEMQMSTDRQTTTMGMMPKYIFLMRNYKLDEKTAKRWIAEVVSEQPESTIDDEE
jgi:A118 family predicted phage portal protein